MICSKFEALTPKERKEFFAKLSHAFQHDNVCFEICKRTIALAENMGIFHGVVFSPESNPLIENADEKLKQQLNEQHQI